MTVRAATTDDLAGLVDVLLDVVDGNASVGFMAPLDPAVAAAHWRATLDDGERAVFVATDDDDGSVVGTAQVILRAPENQRHRGDVSKVLVHRRARRRGIGDALMRAVEATATDAGKTLLVLDTASADAERLYERLGWQRVGTIPGYALNPDGTPCDTVIYFKVLAP